MIRFMTAHRLTIGTALPLILAMPAVAQEAEITPDMLEGVSQECRSLGELSMDMQDNPEVPMEDVVRSIQEDSAESCATLVMDIRNDTQQGADSGSETASGGTANGTESPASGSDTAMDQAQSSGGTGTGGSSGDMASNTTDGTTSDAAGGDMAASPSDQPASSGDMASGDAGAGSAATGEATGVTYMVSELTQMDVVTSDDETLGTPAAVIAQDGAPALILRQGGFLGMFARSVPVPLSEVSISEGRIRLTDMTMEQVSNADGVDYTSDQDLPDDDEVTVGGSDGAGA